ncbi:glycosyltransferase family 2 protein [Silvibacterium dinghuense]|nr:glycosyltransferase family 2 protein [Silvibacterium dinghuense]GGG92890.1 hypothetical protein GCM10011586_04470 [Silvibacterium dinghuense]
MPESLFSRAGSMHGHADRPREADITVVIPTHQRPELLRRALMSVLRQSYSALEVIVVSDGDDGSDAQAIVDEFRDRRLRVVPLWLRRGGAQARNIGVRMARTPWIAFLDDDDEWHPEKLARQMQATRTMQVEFPVISSQSLVQSNTRAWISPERAFQADEAISDFLFCRSRFIDGAQYMQTSSLLVPQELLLKIPFRPHLRRHQDWDWLLRAAKQPGVAFHMVAQPLSIFHVEEGRNSVGRGQDWEFSHAWATEMRHGFTPRAYSFFLATECVSRAVKSRAGWKAYAPLIRDYFLSGRPTVRSLLTLAGFLFVPPPVQTRIRRAARTRLQPSESSTENAMTPQEIGSLGSPAITTHS